MDFTQWTRQDFIDFETRKQETFKPTQEEIQAEQDRLQAEFNKKVEDTKQFLSAYWIIMTWLEVDYTELYTKYIMWDWVSEDEAPIDLGNWMKRNYKFSKWFWTDEQIQDYITKYSLEMNSLGQFCDFIIANEKA